MKRHLLIGFSAFFTLTLLAPDVTKAQENLQFKIDALTKDSQQKEESEKLKRLNQLYMDYAFETYPEFGTYVGKPTDNGKWTDLSLEAHKKRDEETALFLKAIKSIDADKLSEEDELNYMLLRNSLEEEIEGQQFPGELMPMDQMSGYHQQLAQVISVMVIKDEKDYQDVISRMNKIPVQIDAVINLMQEGIKQKITPPATTLVAIPDQISGLIAQSDTTSVFLKNIDDYINTLPQEKRKSYRDAAIKVLKENVEPALLKLKDYMEKTYIPKSRKTVALNSLPNGKNWYNYQIKSYTTTTLTYNEIHDIGLREVKRIRTDMDSLIKVTGFTGSFQEFAQFLRTDPQFYFESEEELLNAYRVIAKKIDPELPRFFGKLPRLPYGILPVPEYDEKTQTTAYYMRGSAESGRPGYFYANTYDLKSRPKWEMEALTIHEAVPGHHLQIALSQELENVPEFRKYNSYTAFIEGWGLYSESLGQEMGFYKDPYSKFGQLTYEMWRAIRLVVDTGIHGMGWSRQKAIDYFKENAAKTEHDIAVEVDRYIAWPGQALAYKIGELKIKELRAKAEKSLGNNFDIRKFHDAVLENGALPLEVLEVKIDEWIAAEKQI